MKLVVVGLGQCGGRIADEFAKLNSRAKSRRGMTIVTGTFAVNTDAADLSGLSAIANDHRHRILIGSRKTGGHGVGKINELGAEVAKDDADKIVDAIRTTKRFYDTDAFLLIAGTAGGTGSGAISVVSQHLKERYIDKPVWNLLVLPFEHEESTEERTVFNVATCLKSCYSVADAVFLIDNEMYQTEDLVKGDYTEINRKIVEPFYNLLCAGAEKRKKHIGAKLLDAGDIMQTLGGWTAIGSGRIDLPVTLGSILPGGLGKRSSGTSNGIRAMDEAIGELSWLCRPEDAANALYLIAAPAQEIDVDLIRALADYLKKAAPNAIIRSGDYPVGRGMIEVTVILSRLTDVARVRYFYSRSAGPPGERTEPIEKGTEEA